MTVLLEDTRQQKDKHEIKHEWWGQHDVALIRQALKFGDYCLPPIVSVDTKKDLYELASNIDQEHERFRRELIGARDAGIQLVILVENEDGVTNLETLSRWREPWAHMAMRVNAVRRIDGARLAKACSTMSERYGAIFKFCKPEEAASLVVDILLKGGRR